MANRNTHYQVRNLNGTTKNKCWCHSWIKHWRAVTGVNFPVCSVMGCSREGEVGAHVQVIDGRFYRSWYIVPFCRGHNHTSNTELMYLKRSSQLVSASVSLTCGHANWEL